MGLGDSPLLKTIMQSFGMLIKFLDNAYKEGWLMYLIVGMVVFLAWVLFF